MHAQALIEPYPGKVLLLSPIVGEFANGQPSMGFIPPRSTRLAELGASKKYPVPLNCEIYVGEQNWQVNPDNVT